MSIVNNPNYLGGEITRTMIKKKLLKKMEGFHCHIRHPCDAVTNVDRPARKQMEAPARILPIQIE